MSSDTELEWYSLPATADSESGWGLYLHIPYCKKACTYCDFYFTTSPKTMPDFVPALLAELHRWANPELGWVNQPIRTVYWGGGTPGRLEPEAIAKIARTIRELFRTEPDAEWTLEVNPDDVSPQRLESWRKAGINRLSIGIQTFQPDRLVWMNRAHTAEQARVAVRQARKAGFANLTGDWIFGLPGTDISLLRADLNSFLELGLPHLSAYGLTVEGKTLLAHQVERGLVAELLPQEFEQQFLFVFDELEKAGYEGYEISNFARPGFRAVHNSNYWEQKPYLGLGPSAHSFNGRNRWRIVPDIHRYLSHPPPVVDMQEVLSPSDRWNELIMTRLRTRDGFRLTDLPTDWGAGWQQTILETIGEWQRAGWAVFTPDNRLHLTRLGRLRADSLAAELFHVDTADV